MLIFKDQILKFKSKCQVEYVLNIIILSIVMVIVCSASYALIRPVNIKQYQQVKILAKQQICPQTQLMAESLLLDQPITHYKFLRLMHAHHFEYARMNQYPAMAIEDE